jgi:hypothetical protein
MATGQPPAVFYALTIRERNAFTDVCNEMNKRR